MELHWLKQVQKTLEKAKMFLEAQRAVVRRSCV